MVTELLTGALVVITTFYAWATYKILRANENVVEAMREQALAALRPYVVVAPMLEVDNPVFYLRFSNTGKTAAENLRLSIDKSFFKFGEKTQNRDLATFTAFNQPIARSHPARRSRSHWHRVSRSSQVVPRAPTCHIPSRLRRGTSLPADT